jgi:hypothetical protein
MATDPKERRYAAKCWLQHFLDRESGATAKGIAMGSSKGNVYGEGNYEATRQYNEATKKFIEAGKVEKAAQDAAPRNEKEAAEMKQSEQAALLRAKDSPPPVREPAPPKPAVEDPPRPKGAQGGKSR